LNPTLLVEQCKKQDRKAQMALYRMYCDGMYIIAQRYVKDTAAAQDALQDAFIKAFQKIDQFKGDVTFGAWLKRIVINTCLDAIKARKMEQVSINDVLTLADAEDDWMVADSMTAQEVVSAISNLKPPYDVVSQLFLLEGYDHQEISEILSISETASRTYLHRAKKKLQEKLKHLRYGTEY